MVTSLFRIRRGRVVRYTSGPPRILRTFLSDPASDHGEQHRGVFAFGDGDGEEKRAFEEETNAAASSRAPARGRARGGGG